jgi:hypothetical protein
MNLPNAENAIIAEDKILKYLLDLQHRRGSSKAKLLHSLGYEPKHWQLLADDLRRQHLTSEVIELRDTVWGKRYEIVAPLTGLSGDTVLFRSIWQIDLGTNHPRLITMYPE